MSKGSRPRPFSVPQEEIANRIEGIFGKKPPREPYVYKPPEGDNTVEQTEDKKEGVTWLRK
jgi:hypothetical protein